MSISTSKRLSLSTPPLSPIASSSQIHALCPTGGRRLRKSESLGGTGDATHPHQYTFAEDGILSSTMLYRDQERGLMQALSDIDSTKLLYQNIKLLQMLLRIEMAEELGPMRPSEDQKYRIVESSAIYQFQYDCFSGPCAEASFHIFRLLFQCYNLSETESRFRDVWPIHDKKMEGAFRRACLLWLKEIVQRYPEYFESIKVEALGGLLVTPGGDRFIHLIESFVALVMYLKLSSSDLLEADCGKVIGKPKCFFNHEVTSKQILYLRRHTSLLAERTARHKTMSLKIRIATRKRLDLVAARRTAFQERLQAESVDPDDVRKIMHNVGLPVSEFVAGAPSRYLSVLQPLLKPTVGDKLKSDIEDIESLLHDFMHHTVYMEGRALEECYDSFSTLWHIMERDNKVDNVLNITDLFYLKNSTKDVRSILDFVNTVKEVATKLVKDHRLNHHPATDLVRRFKELDMRFKCIKQGSDVQEKHKAGIDEKLHCCHQSLLQDPAFSKPDWRVLSKLYVTPLRFEGNLSPATRQIIGTGYTPRIANFLQESAINGKPLSDTSSDSTLQPDLVAAAFGVPSPLYCSPHRSRVLTPRSCPSNKSIIESWEDEKGILETSCTGLLLSDDDMD